MHVDEPQGGLHTQRHRRKSVVRRAPTDAEFEPTAPTGTDLSVKRHSTIDRETPRLARSTGAPAFAADTFVKRHLPPIKTRPSPTRQAQRDVAGPWVAATPRMLDTPATQHSSRTAVAGLVHSTAFLPLLPPSTSSTALPPPDALFWAVIEQLGGRDAVLAKLTYSRQGCATPREAAPVPCYPAVQMPALPAVGFALPTVGHALPDLPPVHPRTRSPGPQQIASTVTDSSPELSAVEYQLQQRSAAHIQLPPSVPPHCRQPRSMRSRLPAQGRCVFPLWDASECGSQPQAGSVSGSEVDAANLAALTEARHAQHAMPAAAPLPDAADPLWTMKWPTRPSGPHSGPAAAHHAPQFGPPLGLPPACTSLHIDPCRQAAANRSQQPQATVSSGRARSQNKSEQAAGGDVQYSSRDRSRNASRDVAQPAGSMEGPLAANTQIAADMVRQQRVEADEDYCIQAHVGSHGVREFTTTSAGQRTVVSVGEGGGVKKRIILTARDSKRHYVHDATCYNCGSVPATPQMRRGPCGERTLCNACGSKLLKGTFMAASATKYPELYPINHKQRLIFWPGKQTRVEDMLPRVNVVQTIAGLLDQGYRFQYEKQEAATQTIDRIHAFLGSNQAHRAAGGAIGERRAQSTNHGATAAVQSQGEPVPDVQPGSVQPEGTGAQACGEVPKIHLIAHAGAVPGTWPAPQDSPGITALHPEPRTYPSKPDEAHGLPGDGGINSRCQPFSIPTATSNGPAWADKSDASLPQSSRVQLQSQVAVEAERTADQQDTLTAWTPWGMPPARRTRTGLSSVRDTHTGRSATQSACNGNATSQLKASMQQAEQVVPSMHAWTPIVAQPMSTVQMVPAVQVVEGDMQQDQPSTHTSTAAIAAGLQGTRHHDTAPVPALLTGQLGPPGNVCNSELQPQM